MTDILERATKALEQAGWRPKDELTDTSEPVVYRRPNPRGGWHVGIAYWTVSAKWNPEMESTVNPGGFTDWLPLPLPDQPDPLAAVAAELLDEVKRLREALRRTENSLTASIEVIEKHVPSDALGINSSGDMEESHLTWSWPILDEFLHYVKIDRDAARALLPEVTP